MPLKYLFILMSTCLIGTDGTALAQRHIGLGGAVRDIWAPHPRAAVRVVDTVVHLHSC
jgi:hypothetical protein